MKFHNNVGDLTDYALSVGYKQTRSLLGYDFILQKDSHVRAYEVTVYYGGLLKLRKIFSSIVEARKRFKSNSTEGFSC